VLEEIFKILRCGGASRAFELLRTAGALPVVLPSLAELLEGGDAATRVRFHSYLSALDELVRSGEEVSEGVLLGALLTHLRHGPGGDAAADALLTQLVQTARLPRRIAERTRLAMAAQRTLLGPPRRRRRGGGMTAQAYFRDALQLLAIAVRATGEGAEPLARWQAEGERRGSRGEGALEGREGGAAALEEEGGALPAGETPNVEVEASLPSGAHGSPAEGEGSGRRHRRRRGGRRRRRRGRGGGAALPGAAAATVPTA